MRIARNFALLGIMAMGLLFTPSVKADTCGDCTCAGTCQTYSCGFLWLKTCCSCNPVLQET